MKWLLPVFLVFIVGCAPVPSLRKPAVLIPGDPSAPSQVTPEEAMAIARSYTTHPWQPFACNILHGKDRMGVLVNTPDIGHEPQKPRKGWWIPGEVNLGIPYKWGGSDSISSFDASISRGLAGGDVSTPEKRLADNRAVSRQASGVDCSGFVSQCLKLPSTHDTTQLPSVCAPLSSGQDLRPGDLLNIVHRHVILCAGWSNPDHTYIYYYETGGSPDYWRPGLKQAPLAALLALGYQPLRYRGMAHESVPAGSSAKEVLTRGEKAKSVVVEHPTVGEP